MLAPTRLAESIDQKPLIAVILTIEQLAHYRHVARVAAAVLLWYDYSLTFAWEKERIWSSRKGWFVVFWCLLRYPPLILKTAISTDFAQGWKFRACQQFFVFEWLSTSLALSVSHLSFIFRLYALYADSLKLLAMPVLLWMAHLVPIFMIAHKGGNDPSIIAPNGKCLPAYKGNLLVVSIFLSSAFDCVVLVMVTTRCVSLWRRQADKGLLSILLRDGLGYFGIVTLMNFLSVIGLMSGINPVVIQIILTLSPTLPIIIVCRMILSLRSVKRSWPALSSDESASHISLDEGLTFPHQVISRSNSDEFSGNRPPSHHPYSL
ncbi:hypothetical protein BKA62DRAFT_260406 [Auriculariales sp. MPI-PUGE-AT-0066]|nr:hypothetical protein BKA62DRAFT_260406 [Auriculariales sp. MPI-PUGE-AT-0066]